MPTLRRACAYPGCGSLAVPGTHRCADHATHYDDNRPSAARRGYDRRWRRLRKYYLSKHPVCVRCGRPATEVDHIIPLADGGTHHEDNLQPLCKPCHSRKTNEDIRRRGS